MSHEHEDIDPFELELAALEQLPKERIRELESIGHASAIEELRQHNNRFHEHHDPDVMLRQIHRQHQNMISTQTPSVATWPRPWLKPAALVAFMLTLGFGVAFLRPDPSVEATSTAPDMAMESVKPSIRCDTTRRWSSEERAASDPPGRANLYTLTMLSCLYEGTRELQKREAAVVSPPASLVYACRQRFGFACAALGTLELSGPAIFDEGYLATDSLLLDPTGETWIWGSPSRYTPRYAQVANPKTAAATTTFARPHASCDTSRSWTSQERAATHPDSIMLASPYREHMLACLSDGLLALKDDARPPAALVHACEQRSSFACAALGTFLYAGAKPLSHGDLTRAEVRPAQSRMQGAKALRRACALDNVSACALLARILIEDPTTQAGTGYNPAQIKAYANPSFEGERRGDDTNL